VGVGGLRLPEPVAGGLEPFEGSKFGRLGVVDTEVRYGGVVVGRSPQVRDRTDAGAFLVFSEPLPVGTSLTLKIDEKEQPAVVTEVVESADASAAGMRVRFGTAAAKTAPASRPPERAAAPAPAPAPAAAAPAPVAAAPAPAPVAAPPPAPAAPAPAAVVATPASEPASAPVPVPVGTEGSTGSTGVPSGGDASAQHAADPHAHHDGEHGRRKRRRK